MTLQQVADVVGGTVHGDGSVLVRAPAVADSRDAEPGGLFAAFLGEHADGHAFAGDAVARGAVAVLGSRPTTSPTVVVADPQHALQLLARHVLMALRSRAAAIGGPRVLAVTGSQGKTTVKDMLARVLGDAAPTVATRASYNNELGLPLTVLRATAHTRYLVLEMGARGIGHLAQLCRVAVPDVAVVLNVGKAHLGEFGSQAAIAQAKGELVEAVPTDGVAVLNADDALVSAMAERTSARIVRFGESPESDVRLAGVRLDDLSRPAFDLVTDDAVVHVQLRLVGEHQAHNAAATAAAATAVGLPLAAVADSLGGVDRLSPLRMEVHERADGVTVIDDTYNANPDSMRAALKTLAAIGRARGSRTVAVLGEMRELGESSRDEHDAVGRLAVRLDIAQLLVVGEAARPLHLGACLEGSWGEESVFVADNDEALGWLRTHLRAGDVVLLKASRGAALDRVSAALLRPDAEGPGAR